MYTNINLLTYVGSNFKYLNFVHLNLYSKTKKLYFIFLSSNIDIHILHRIGIIFKIFRYIGTFLFIII